MELDRILRLRPVVGAGLFVTLTRRCPLSCAHCSTASTVGAEQLAAAPLRRFVSTYTAADRPEVTFFTGGEPLLRPRLLVELAGAVRGAGGASAVLTGAFFARTGQMPPAVLRALLAVDHVSVSLDPFHEREVPRPAALRLLRLLRERGIAVSVHLTAPRPDDGYTDSVLADLRGMPGGGVPALVTRVRPVGRAASWAGPAAQASGDGPLPCAMAAWPVVTFDGLVTACCHQPVVDRRPVPEHLLLGDVAVDTWPTVRARTLGSPALRCIRIAGPDRLRRRAEPDPSGPAPTPTSCDGCRRLGELPGLAAAAAHLAGSPAGAAADALVAQLQVDAGPAVLLRRYAGAGSVLR